MTAAHCDHPFAARTIHQTRIGLEWISVIIGQQTYEVCKTTKTIVCISPGIHLSARSTGRTRCSSQILENHVLIVYRPRVGGEQSSAWPQPSKVTNKLITGWCEIYTCTCSNHKHSAYQRDHRASKASNDEMFISFRRQIRQKNIAFTIV